jgi:endonuclease/exonuclease/phosphatase family metal-dependent hydrolase
LLDSGGFYLSQTPEVWSLGWDATYVKALTWARFRRTEDQSEFLSLNTHLEHIGELARVESVRLILRRLAELRGGGLPVIFTGDFNCNPWAPGYRVYVETTFTDACYHLLRAYGFADTFLDAGGEDSTATCTFHGFEGARYWAANHHMAGRIDWILTLASASSVQANECSIVRDAEPPVYPSDHYPVVADLVLGV